MSQVSPELDAAIAEAGLVPGRSPSPLRLPDPRALFAKRAARLRALAPGHSLDSWLRFVADLADAQHEVVQAAALLLPDRQWRKDLQSLLAALKGTLPAPAVEMAETLRHATDAELDERQSRLQSGKPTPDDLAAAPFLGAAEQIAWTRFAALQDASAMTPAATAHQCPVCGRPPVAGMIHIGSEASGLRYLHCGCCGSAWHHVRATCVACGDGKGVHYRLIEGGNDGVRAECCDSCHSTLKQFLLEKSPDFEPVADDLASLPLDILVGEEGYQRIGGNPFLVMG
ncbi:MAG TPA: formate dehydrogenase accessory protein FdhE [Candidatus Sulfotelmatobacter sp.]|jgi:FdhE protein|nr:formate dehydrogenase accessory protein FdhE [Candidatus Sulfotelmatobacter sp.]